MGVMSKEETMAKVNDVALTALRRILSECDQRPKDDEFAYELAALAADAIAKAEQHAASDSDGK